MKEKFYKEGFVVIKNFYQKKVFKEVYLTLNNLLLNSKYKKIYKKFKNKNIEINIDKMLSFLKKNDQKFFSKIYENMSNQFFFENFMNEKFKKTISKISGKKIFDLHFEQKILRIDVPNFKKNLLSPHQDLLPLSIKQKSNKINGITIWCPLRDTNQVLGGIMVAPKSHKLGWVTHFSRSKKKYTSAAFKVSKELLKNLQFRQINTKKGDLLIMNTMLVHKSVSSNSDKVRYTVQFRVGINENYNWI